jgi:hypothetical protein
VNKDGKKPIKLEVMFPPNGGWRATIHQSKNGSEGPFDLTESSRTVSGLDGQSVVMTTMNFPEILEVLLPIIAEQIQSER